VQKKEILNAKPGPQKIKPGKHFITRHDRSRWGQNSVSPARGETILRKEGQLPSAGQIRVNSQIYHKCLGGKKGERGNGKCHPLYWERRLSWADSRLGPAPRGGDHPAFPISRAHRSTSGMVGVCSDGEKESGTSGAQSGEDALFLLSRVGGRRPFPRTDGGSAPTRSIIPYRSLGDGHWDQQKRKKSPLCRVLLHRKGEGGGGDGVVETKKKKNQQKKKKKKQKKNISEGLANSSDGDGGRRLTGHEKKTLMDKT